MYVTPCTCATTGHAQGCPNAINGIYVNGMKVGPAYILLPPPVVMVVGTALHLLPPRKIV